VGLHVGSGKERDVRDWIYVEDHCRGLWRVLVAGEVGAVYNLCGESEIPEWYLTHRRDCWAAENRVTNVFVSGN